MTRVRYRGVLICSRGLPVKTIAFLGIVYILLAKFLDRSSR